MKKQISLIFTALVTFLFGVSVAVAAGGDIADGRIPVKNLEQDSLSFAAGERLKYVMHYSWGLLNTDVGSAEVRLEKTKYDGMDCFHTVVTGRTTRLFDVVFKVREDFQSWFTCDGLQPRKFTRNSNEGSYHATNSYLYHWGRDSSYIDAEIFSSSKGNSTRRIAIDSATFDLPSLFFFARNMDFSKVFPGKKHPMTFAVDGSKHNVYFILYGRETIDVPGIGSVRTVKFGAKLLAGEVFTGEEDMTIWISDDLNRIPVYFEAPILVGTASGRLAGYSGLKNEFSSMVVKH